MPTKDGAAGIWAAVRRTLEDMPPNLGASLGAVVQAAEALAIMASRLEAENEGLRLALSKCPSPAIEGASEIAMSGDTWLVVHATRRRSWAGPFEAEAGGVSWLASRNLQAQGLLIDVTPHAGLIAYRHSVLKRVADRSSIPADAQEGPHGA